jgi:hypothetical protein
VLVAIFGLVVAGIAALESLEMLTARTVQTVALPATCFIQTQVCLKALTCL